MREATSYALAGLAAAAVLATAASRWQQHANDQELDQHMQHLAADVAASVNARMQRYSYGLRGARGAIVAAGVSKISRQDFQRYALTRSIDDEFPGARGFGFIRRVAVDAESAFLAAARRDGAPDFQIRQLNPHAGERYVIQYIEPQAVNLPALGLDIASEPGRRGAAQRAMRDAEPALTAPITLVQAQGKPQQSFLLLLPVYATPEPPASVAEREAALDGWTYAPLSADDMFAGMDGARPRFQLTLRDVTDAPGSERPPAFYTSLAPDVGSVAERRVALTVFGRQWELQVRPTPAFVQGLNLPSPTGLGAQAAVVAAACTGLAGLLAHLRHRRRFQLEEQARRAAMVDNSVDAFIGLTRDGHINAWNAAAEAMFGYHRDEALGQHLDELLLPAARRHEAADMMERLRQGLPVLTYDTTRLTRDGRELDVAISMAPMRDDEGHVVGVVKTVRDITAAKSAERRLQQLTTDLERQVAERTRGLDAARRDLSNILDALPSMVGYWDRHLRNRFANQAYQRWFGDRAQGLADKTLPELLGPELFERNRPHIEAALRGEPQSFERSIPRPDGPGDRHSLAHYLPDVIDGEVLGFYVLVHDVTELKQAVAELRTTHERLALATDAAGMGVWEYEPATETVIWDDRMFALYGEPVRGEKQPYALWTDRVIPEDREAVEHALRASIDGSAEFSADFRILRADGERRHIRAVAKTYRDDQGRVRRLIGVNWDITARKAAELELAETTSLLRVVLASATEVAIIATDPDFTIRIFNPGAERLLGYSAAEVVGHSTPALIHIPEEIRARARELSIALGREVRGGEFFREPLTHGIAQEWQYRRKDGRTIPVSLTVTAMRDEQGRPMGYLGVARDISTQKRHELALLEAKAIAEQANRAKSQFLATMSHEIRTPMNAVIGLSYLLEQTSLDAYQLELLAKMARASRTLLGVINDVLDLSKIEAGELSISLEPFSPAELLHYLADVMRVQASNKGIELLLQIPSPLPEWVMGDSLRINQVLTNLLGNAIKFTDIGQVCLAVTVLPAPAAQTRLRFEVTDTGMGISPDAMQRLFQPFSQADGSITRRFGGTGLGLSIVKQLTEMMGGTVGVSSEPGVGSRFWAELPLALADSNEHALSRQAPAPGDPHALKGIRVLVVDDSDINLEVARRILESVGAVVTLAANGQQAVDHLRSHGADCDLVLMDIHMPVMDGITATGLIRKQLGLRQLPVVALTAGVLASQRTEARQAGMNDFIAKPFSPADVIHCIARLVNGSAARRLALSVRPVVPADWPQIAGIDAAEAAPRVGGDASLLRQLMESLLREFPSLPLPASDGSNLSELAARLHKLRGSAGNIGANAVHEAATRGEAACQRKDAALAAAEINELNSALATLAEAAAPWLAATMPQPPAPERAEPLGSAQLDKLLNLLHQQHISALDQFELMAAALRDRLGEARFLQLREHVEQLRFAEAAALLDGRA